jgi:peptidoglycan/LPS O-acetylase OafA/YrhL
MIGICLVIITSLRVFGQAEKTIVDQITAIAALFFMVSCMLSFLSIRRKRKSNARMEDLADIIFLGGLSLLFITTILLSFNMIR